MFKTFAPALPQIGIKRLARQAARGRMVVVFGVARAYGKAVYLEVAHVVFYAEVRHKRAQVFNVLGVRRAYVARKRVFVVPYFFQM